ncbi:hypothetical protein DFH07DRAFT_910899, partial [Mycena maculata]
MLVNADEAGTKPPPDNDRLINVLQACFQELINKQDEQTEKYSIHLHPWGILAVYPRIQRAVEALKPQAPVTDKRTTFWNAYMNLADEHDREFQQKYGTDLDTALIFAGLFSAVSSAFIIQIEPQFMGPTSPQVTVVVAQSLLYISLFTTLLAALLAVLGKQWIMYYQAAGSRGTIEERGLERQRKLDGLRKWKFDAVLQMFPLLLQLALLLFSAALSIYLWTIHHAIAIIVWVLTLVGIGLYTFLLVSATRSPDSPFQTPLVPLFSKVNRKIRDLSFQLRNFTRSIWVSWTRFLQSRTHFLPQFISHPSPLAHRRTQNEQGNSKSATPSDAAASLDSFHRDPYILPLQGGRDVSAAVPAVLWVLETSTDPLIITAAAGMAIDIQWPVDLDLARSQALLAQTFISCFEYQTSGNVLRHGMAYRAITCGQAYCSLRLITRAGGDGSREGSRLPGSFLGHLAPIGDASEIEQLCTILSVILDWPMWALCSNWESLQWALHVIPSLKDTDRMYMFQHITEHFLDQFPAHKRMTLDSSHFADYLCCLVSFF